MPNRSMKRGLRRSKPSLKNRRRAAHKTLGPVIDLVQHVPSDWWRGIFNSLYLKTDADYVCDANTTAREVDLALELLAITPTHRVLDLCCGQGRHTLELARRGFARVEGLDQSHYLIQKAKRDAKKAELPVVFSHGDARELGYAPDTFDIVLLLGNSFGYFEAAQDDLKVLKQVFRVLKPGGRLLIDVTDGCYQREHFQPRSWKWIGKNLIVCRERSLSLDGRLVSREIVMDTARGVIADQFYAERLYTRESLAKMLDNANLCEFTVQRQLSSESQWNQDLGMMEHRIIGTAVARK